MLPWSRSTPAAAGAAPTDVAIRWILSAFPSLETSLELTPERAVSLSRQFSLLMVGVIVMSSVRLVLRGVNQVSTNDAAFSLDAAAFCKFAVTDDRVFSPGTTSVQQEPWCFFDAPHPCPAHGVFNRFSA